MGLLISRPSVFVWGTEACLSTLFIVFVERRVLYKGKIAFVVASIEARLVSRNNPQSAPLYLRKH